ncbi:MAE_28990/MAE_18760 family HEPN-like nuclease [Pseudorhodoplanes sp.]|uniref:MAE_28990/MAE_18760 family HEPN-like nuclease n=1 Tax=Pseudorhodoplanes sp. TaxID=1934341 RepID=UPI00391C55F1
MPRYTSSYSSFLSRLDEVNVLRRSAAKKERTNAIQQRAEIDALCRGAIVLLSSHVEAYIKELGEIALQAFFDRAIQRNTLSLRTFYHISKDIIDEVKDTSDHGKIAEKMFRFIDSDAHYWSKSGPFQSPVPSARFNKGFSNPKFDKVSAYFNRFGYDKYRADFYSALRSKAQPTQNMLDHLVDIRNSIAHGDPSATKTPGDLRDMVDTVSQFCRVTDQVFGSWCRRNFCAIR